MDTTTITSVFRLLGEIAKALPINSPAKQQIELLREQINLLERQITSLAKEKADLKAKFDEQAKDLTDLQERFASSQLSTDEYEEDGYLWRRTAQGAKSGPYCPNHRDVRLVRVGSSSMGMYCSKCRVPIRPS
jgi:hypothetical protein